MARRITIIQGHPDAQGHHFGHALASAYQQGALEAGHAITMIEVARLDFPLLRSKADFEQGTPPAAIAQAQQTIAWAEHLVLYYPLWLGTMPALMKGFLEQVFRPGFAIRAGDAEQWPQKLLTGKSARIVITMGMPAAIYRWYFRAHSLKSLERNVLRFSGIHPIKESLIGLVEANNPARHQKWLTRMQALGRTGE